MTTLGLCLRPRKESNDVGNGFTKIQPIKKISEITMVSRLVRLLVPKIKDRKLTSKYPHRPWLVGLLLNSISFPLPLSWAGSKP